MYSVSLMAGSSSFAFQIHCDTFCLDNNVGDRIFLALVRLNKHVQSMYKKNIFFTGLFGLRSLCSRFSTVANFLVFILVCRLFQLQPTQVAFSQL